MSLHPVAAHAETVPTLSVLGGVYRILLDGKQTHGSMALVEIIMPPEDAIPPHVHHREEETFHVLEGEIEVTHGTHTTRLRVGDSLFAPRGIAHSIRVTGGAATRFLVAITPAGFERFFREVADLGERGEANPETVSALLKERYDCEMLPPPQNA